MIRLLFQFCLLFLIIQNSFSQIEFEQGYFLNESGQKTDCFIKNMDWKDNPTVFLYKLKNDGHIEMGTLEDVKEFGIKGYSKYIRSFVSLDRSSDQIEYLSQERNPIFQLDTLFLKVLIEGKASLYKFEDKQLVRFFYNIDNSEIKQLVYKRYILKSDRAMIKGSNLNLSKNFIAENHQFKQQLFLALDCDDGFKRKLNRLKYLEGELKRYFINYHECESSEYINFSPTKTKDLVNFSIRSGINYNKLQIQNSISGSRNFVFDFKVGFRIGGEMEYVMPFNKNKWSIVLDPNYQYYKSQNTIEVIDVIGRSVTAKVNYQTIDLPIGCRHYFFLNKETKLYSDVSFIFVYGGNSSIDFYGSDDAKIFSLDSKSRNNICFSVGYKYNNKFDMSLRYYTNREILGGYQFWTSDFRNYSVIFGYNFF